MPAMAKAVKTEFWQKAHIHQFELAWKKKSFDFLNFACPPFQSSITHSQLYNLLWAIVTVVILWSA